MTLLDFPTDLDTATITESDLLGRSTTGSPTTLRRSTRTVEDVSVIVDGTTARLRYTTDAPVVEILVTPYQPAFIDGMWIDWVMDSLDGADFAAGSGTVDYFHRSLRPGVDYHYVITAHGCPGELPTQVVGSFSTPLRRAA